MNKNLKNNKKQKGVAIIGAGEIGTALEFVLIRKGIASDLWDRDTKKCKKATSFSKVIDNAQIIFLCVPSCTNREIARRIYDNIKNNHKKIVITLSKGIEDKSLKTMEIVLKEELKNKIDYGILVGPMIAEEIKSGQPAVGIIGLSHLRWQTKIEELFQGSNLKIKFSNDLHGLAICSVLKNIYSIAIGMVDGLGFGVNVKSFFTVKSYQEMKGLAEILGGKKETCEGLAGLGDLLATGWSNFSHNFTTGRNIILRNTKNPRSEGCASLPSISKLLGKDIQNYKILYSVKQIILDKKDAKTILKI